MPVSHPQALWNVNSGRLLILCVKVRMDETCWAWLYGSWKRCQRLTRSDVLWGLWLRNQHLRMCYRLTCGCEDHCHLCLLYKMNWCFNCTLLVVFIFFKVEWSYWITLFWLLSFLYRKGGEEDSSFFVESGACWSRTVELPMTSWFKNRSILICKKWGNTLWGVSACRGGALGQWCMHLKSSWGKKECHFEFT